ncbi:MAG TPA: AI-2E family transporter [Bacillota bacterium]|nr:AI-2E family transporter [Bacillota bacterium]
MKKRRISDESLSRIIKYLAIIILGFGIILLAIQFSDFWNWIFRAIKSVIIPISLAYFSALIIFPLIKYLEKKGVGPRGFSLGLVFVLTVGLIFAVFYFLTPLIINEIQNFFTDDYPVIVDYINNDLRNEFLFGADLYDKIIAYFNETNLIADTVDSFVPKLITSLTSMLLPLFTALALLPILLIFYLNDYEVIAERIRSIIPPKYEKNVAELSSRLNQTVGAYLRGQLILMVVLGSVATIAYKLIGLKYYFFFGFLVGVTNIIPYFGMLIAAVPPIVYTFIATSGPGPLLVLLVNVVMQFIEGNIFQPLIMSHQLSLHPIIIIISILFFGSLFGAIGVIFASPIAASIKVIYRFFTDLKKEKLKNSTTEATSS